MIYIFSFIAGGAIASFILLLEESGHPILSGLATLFPIMTWLSYIFFGFDKEGVAEVVYSSKFVLLGTIFAWIPYILIIHFLAPKIGIYKSIILAIVVFLILAFIYIWLEKTYKFI